MASDRRRGFEAWARNSGDPAIRAADRRAIAEDLFEMAGGGDVRNEHVEDLGRRYRERLAGAQKILLARQVGDEIQQWQDEPRAAPARGGDARREDDEVIGIALDTSPGREVGDKGTPPAEMPALDLSLPLPPAPPLAASRPTTPLPRSATPVQRPATPLGTPVVGSPDRPRSGAAQDWAGPARSTTGAREHGPSSVVAAHPPEPSSPQADARGEPEEQGLWAPLRESSPPSRRDVAHHEAPSLQSVSVPPGSAVEASSTAPPSDPPPTEAPVSPPVRRASSRPPAAMLGRIEVVGMSARPPAPASPAASRTISVPPERADAPVAPTPTAALQGPLLAKIGAGLGVVLLVSIFALRPSCLFPAPTKEVQGRFDSKHLGIAATFPEPWTHAGPRDDGASRNDWRRASSMFYQGVNVDEFAIQLTLVTLSHDDRPATNDDLRSIGAGELAGGSRNKRCAPYEREGTTAVRCTSEQTLDERSYAMMEEYFLAGPRIVYARGLVEGIVTGTVEVPSDDDAVPGRPRSQPVASPVAEIDARRMEAVLDSIVPLPD